MAKDFIDTIVDAIEEDRRRPDGASPDRIFAAVAAIHPEPSHAMEGMLRRAIPGLLRDWR
ncbi:hypothetical protein WV31_10025 [Magnetospirillum sp. ME-1]|uniref:hypothetical protein n=1 Tax=Magnetospirillum sp. ME-1 TaxID=1639348 RepID=UPI000A17CFE1|nr:hypothetical protein [Magnetospirillum sp. ME-1]ARJ65965.1 hypothetical protein WV31_10025 [Magnetospirillum sp. ME-1]